MSSVIEVCRRFGTGVRIKRLTQRNGGRQRLPTDRKPAAPYFGSPGGFISLMQVVVLDEIPWYGKQAVFAAVSGRPGPPMMVSDQLFPREMWKLPG